jgi:hypothetical protein
VILIRYLYYKSVKILRNKLNDYINSTNEIEWMLYKSRFIIKLIILEQIYTEKYNENINLTEVVFKSNEYKNNQALTLFMFFDDSLCNKLIGICNNYNNIIENYIDNNEIIMKTKEILLKSYSFINTYEMELKKLGGL